MKKKLLVSLVCIILIIIFNFALPRLMPGDTVLMLVGMDESTVSENEYLCYLEKTGLDRPLSEQFLSYIKGIFTGDLGYSYHYNENITSLIMKRLPATLQIALPAVILSSLIALAAGCIGGMKRGSAGERAFTTLQIVFDALPNFLTGLMLIALFAFKLRWLPMGSLSSAYVEPGFFGFLSDRISHLILPVLTIVLSNVPAKYLMLSGSVAAQKNEKYVLYARSRGLTDRQIAFRHIFPNVCQPFITMVGMNIGGIVSGSLVIENIFSVKGMGSLMSQAITSRDYPVLQGCLLVSALVIVVLTLITDGLCILTDPKVRCRVHEAE